ncbi:hypothetical protein ATO49_28030 [Mycolicibacterium fortuitum subsp. fortuitum DSM 46621 = ATCC 6841 = JCM 6387]|nr:hypothetical protein ATO49_28030 [Mycolicibacterium fortuitum subsp. fortuitum DSM 46621 = ATCC 6841 = JCM 6387]
MQQNCGGQVHDARRHGVHGRPVAPVPRIHREFDHQVHQLFLQLLHLLGQLGRQIMTQQLVAADLKQQPRRGRVAFGEDHRSLGGCGDRVGTVGRLLDQLALQGQEPPPGPEPHLAEQTGPGAERVIERAVGQPDGVAEGTDGHRCRS